jgi:hypothetical protein
MNEAITGTKPTLAARCARGLGTFNVAYGTIGLASAAIIHLALPSGMNPLPPSVMVASVVASTTAIAQGVLLRIYGPALTGCIGRRIKTLAAWSKATLLRIASNGNAA